MTHEELRGEYELYALGAAEEPERSEIREHLARGCEVCMAEMGRARAWAALMGTTAPAAAPSPGLRRRILASIGHEPQRLGWAPFLGLATALATFAAFYFSAREHQIAAQRLVMREEMRRRTIELVRLQEAFAILSGPSTTEVSFGQGPKGKVYVDRIRGVVLIASNLPPAPAGKTYEMWVIPRGGKPVAAGLFQPDASGGAMHFERGAVDPNLAVVAVTVEDAAGATAPTSTPVIAAELR